MKAAFQRSLRSGREYDQYFPVEQLLRTDPVAIKRGDTFDTIDLMAKLVRQYQSDTARISPVLKGKTLEQTCRAIWKFAYEHFQYTQDKDGVEQLRRPLRAWADRQAGIDCDCYSILVSTILLNLGIAHKLRKTKYNNLPDYQHIYVIVPKPDGSYFTIDPVTDAFDKEVAFTGKYDKSMMPIQVLNGPGDAPAPVKPLVQLGSFGQFGFGAEFIGLAAEADQVRKQTLQTIRTTSLQGLAAAAISNVLPTAEQAAELASVTGQSNDEAIADYVAVAHLSASFVERLRQSLINTGEQIDLMPAEHRGPELLRLRGRLNLLLTSWSNEAERTRLFETLGEQEDMEYRQVGLQGLGMGNIFSDAWNGVKNAVSSVGGAISQAATWTYSTVIKPVGQAVAQAATWSANTVATGVKAAATGIKNAAVWVGNEAVDLGKLIVKYNPLSVLIRAGLRIAFRVNIFYMAGRLGHGYFSEAQARAFGMEMSEWQKAKSTLGKVISLWEGLQGDTDILRESIMVGYQSGEQPKIAAQPALSGLAGGLGDGGIVSGPSAVAASGFIATIVAWLKNVDWGKLLSAVTTVAQKLKLVKDYNAVPPITANTQLPSTEQAYAANKTLYDAQAAPASTNGSTSMMLPLAVGAVLVGAFLLNTNSNGKRE